MVGRRGYSAVNGNQNVLTDPFHSEHRVHRRESPNTALRGEWTGRRTVAD